MTHLTAHEIVNGLLLNWDKEGEYHSGISFEWRNILLHLKVDVETFTKSRTDTITIQVNGENYRFGVGRATIGAGAIGKQPTIETSRNFLSIVQRDKEIILKDNLKDGENASDVKYPFKVICIPANFNF